MTPKHDALRSHWKTHESVAAMIRSTEEKAIKKTSAITCLFLDVAVSCSPTGGITLPADGGEVLQAAVG